ncbi:bifunctional sulfate adenylyltransferase subunit 1/adenylylsulfate kinase [Methylocaldum marinum]|uniref:Sulfate adenylyltransferase subunit 1 n=1 Tax=Methylocaldum marinum TaxID=1432792 RepID=A0A250KV38_9GAMM|nr:sulfate adenylyltransferase subunit CysN [Methylocaldum marinum]BBA33649.1 bifunctional sulfate adenylyltransferase subunit 1/adenylylsulfate kinase [Methylocaldum marinum]
MSHQSELISSDIHAYLAQHERKELLRFLTCGNVDDGKSTLIGRLLHDSKMIYEDQLAAIKKDSVKSGTTGGDIDLALLVDGLQAEREQGITIDVAYRYFSTAKRKYIIADTPGHEQYTRNMATGASTCDLAIILVDARHGVMTQTKRHSFIVSLLGIKHVVVAINKMDLVGYSSDVFERIRSDYLAFIEKLDIHDVRFIPLSALMGDNVVSRSGEMPWYQGQALMELLDTIEIAKDQNFTNPRFPVQYVNRPNLDFRGYSGTVAAGVFRKGDAITVLPSRKTSCIKSIVTYDGELEEAFPPQAVTITLADEIDVSRGDMLVRSGDLPMLGTRFKAHIVWMTEAPLVPGRQYYLKQTAKIVNGSVSQIHHRIDINTLEQLPADQLKLNEIGLCEVALNAPIAFDPYKGSKSTGSFIIIDRLTNVTVGAGMIVAQADGESGLRSVTAEERGARFGQKAVTLWITGERRQDLAYELERKLFDVGHASTVLDDSELGEQFRIVAAQINHAGLICICPCETRPGDDGLAALHVSADEMNADAVLALLRETQVLAF